MTSDYEFVIVSVHNFKRTFRRKRWSDALNLPLNVFFIFIVSHCFDQCQNICYIIIHGKNLLKYVWDITLEFVEQYSIQGSSDLRLRGGSRTIKTAGVRCHAACWLRPRLIGRVQRQNGANLCWSEVLAGALCWLESSFRVCLICIGAEVSVTSSDVRCINAVKMSDSEKCVVRV